MLGGSVEGLNEEHFISVQFFYNSSLRDQTQIWCSLFKFKHYLQAWTTSGKELLVVYAKKPMEMTLSIIQLANVCVLWVE
jgi:hypothetical protein